MPTALDNGRRSPRKLLRAVVARPRRRAVKVQVGSCVLTRPKGGNIPAMRLREERREANQRRFQLANQRLHDFVDGQLPELAPVAFLCECADEECMGRVEVTLTQWEDVTQRPNHFLIIAGHPRIEGEQVVESLGRYEAVQKPDS